MPPQQNGPVADGAAIRAGYQVASPRFDTANRSTAQSANPLFGIRLRGFRPLAKGTLIGFADIELPGALLVHDCPVFRAKDGSAWAALPAKPVVDRDGKQKADANGKRQFAPVLEWCNRELANRFSAVVINLIRRAAPDTLDGGAP
jgi:hypothetical protein